MKIYAIAVMLVLCSVSRETFGFEGDPFSDDGCGSERGCFNCGEDCAVMVAYEPDMEEGVTKFTLWGTMTGNEAHVSMGITTSRSMSNADVYSCISNGTSQRLVRSWNPSSGRTTEPRNLTGIFDQEVSVMDGEIRCQFTRYFNLDNNDPEFFNLNDTDATYYLIVSRGGLNAQGLVGGHVSTNRGFSGVVDLSMFSTGNMVKAQFGIWTLLLSLIVAFRVY